MRLAPVCLFVLVFSGCTGAGRTADLPSAEARAAPAEVIRVANIPVEATMGGSPSRRYALYSLRENRLVQAYDAESRADSASTAWDIGFRGVEVIVNGGANGPGRGGVLILEEAFEAVVEAPEGEYADAAPSGSGRSWYRYDPGASVVAPLPERTLVVRVADGRYAKVRILSYYRDAPAEPNPFEHEARHYTFEYLFQPDGSRRLAWP